MEIRANNLKRHYNNKPVLDIDKLIIPKGKITGITGSNGSGKSTLLNIISGLDVEYSGTITYDNKALNNDIMKMMTYVFQKPYLFRRTVLENIQYPLKIRGIEQKDIRSLSHDILERLEVSELKLKKGHLLSGGESQKVALARAIVFNPELLLLDEPTSNIDPESIKIMEREIINFNKETNATIIIVTHNLQQSERLCDNIICLEEGRIC